MYEITYNMCMGMGMYEITYNMCMCMSHCVLFLLKQLMHNTQP